MKQAYDYWQNQPDLNCVVCVVYLGCVIFSPDFPEEKKSDRGAAAEQARVTREALPTTADAVSNHQAPKNDDETDSNVRITIVCVCVFFCVCEFCVGFVPSTTRRSSRERQSVRAALDLTSFDCDS